MKKNKEELDWNQKTDIEEIISVSLEAMEYVSKELKEDKELINSYQNLKKNYLNLEFNLKELFPEEKAIEILKNDGLALKYFPKELRNNKRIVLAAIKENNLALQFASEELQKVLKIPKKIYTNKKVKAQNENER